MIIFLPHNGTNFQSFQCVCENTKCKILSENFQKINDARGGFFTIPSGKENEYTTIKKDLILKHMNISDIKRNARIAVHHFDPTDLQNTCCVRQNLTFLYKWRLSSTDAPKGTIEVVPWYPLEKAEEDYLAVRKAIEDGPSYNKASRKKTEEMVTLMVSDVTKLSKEDIKKMKDFSYYIRRQKEKGIPIPLERIARLNQIGFDFSTEKIKNKKRKLDSSNQPPTGKSSND